MPSLPSFLYLPPFGTPSGTGVSGRRSNWWLPFVIFLQASCPSLLVALQATKVGHEHKSIRSFMHLVHCCEKTFLDFLSSFSSCSKIFFSSSLFFLLGNSIAFKVSKKERALDSVVETFCSAEEDKEVRPVEFEEDLNILHELVSGVQTENARVCEL